MKLLPAILNGSSKAPLPMVLHWIMIGSFGEFGSDSFSPRFRSSRGCCFATLFFLQRILQAVGPIPVAALGIEI